MKGRIHAALMAASVLSIGLGQESGAYALHTAAAARASAAFHSLRGTSGHVQSMKRHRGLAHHSYGRSLSAGTHRRVYYSAASRRRYYRYTGYYYGRHRNYYLSRGLHRSHGVSTVATHAPSVSDFASAISDCGARIARSALAVASRMNTVGWCYKGVATALCPLGVHLSGGAAYQAKDQLLRDKRFHPVPVRAVGDLRPGDILVHGASASHPYGHIAVYLGGDHEASDHVQPVVLNGPYSGTTVFRHQSG